MAKARLISRSDPLLNEVVSGLHTHHLEEEARAWARRWEEHRETVRRALIANINGYKIPRSAKLEAGDYQIMRKYLNSRVQRDGRREIPRTTKNYKAIREGIEDWEQEDI